MRVGMSSEYGTRNLEWQLLKSEGAKTEAGAYTSALGCWRCGRLPSVTPTLDLLGAAAPGQGASAFGRGAAAEPSLGLEHLPQDEFNLTVQAPQLIIGPRLDGVEHGRIDSQQERLPLSHASPLRSVRPDPVVPTFRPARVAHSPAPIAA